MLSAEAHTLTAVFTPFDTANYYGAPAPVVDQAYQAPVLNLAAAASPLIGGITLRPGGAAPVGNMQMFDGTGNFGCPPMGLLPRW